MPLITRAERTRVSETNGKVATWCKASGVSPKQLFDQAVTE